jgi:tetratricopeptide (TPR) repeat protein
MKSGNKGILAAVFLIAGMMGAKTVLAQAQGTPPATTPPATTPAQGDKDKGVAPLTMDAGSTAAAPAALQPPVNAEEDAAIKAFRDAPLTDMPKKLKMGDDFLTKYPQSRYRAEVYSWQVKGYMASGEIDKMGVAGEKELELAPNDAQTLAILGSMLPRSMPSNMTEAQKQKLLTEAEEYSKKALDLAPTLPKPAGITDAQFIAAKNQIQAMAYNGLGLVAFRRAKYTDAIPNLEQSAKLDPNPDPVNYFLLGVSNEKASHFEDAIAAFTKCAAIPNSLQPTCKAGIDEAKKLSATQLSVPK